MASNPILIHAGDNPQNATCGEAVGTGEPPARLGGVRRVASHSLFWGDREIEIEHNGALYRLRQTAMGKLILTK